MATLTIRQLSDETHAQLRLQAATHGRSVEAEVRAILDATAARGGRNVLVALYDATRDCGADLDLPARGDVARAADFS